MALILLFKLVKKLIRELIYDQMKIVWRNLSFWFRNHTLKTFLELYKIIMLSLNRFPNGF